jgi:hypothetical protein
MTTRRKVQPAAEEVEAPVIEPEPKPAVEPEPELDPEPEPEPEPPEPEAVADPFVIGPPSTPMTPGWLMGIGSRPQTPAEHATRLGTSAGTFADAGFLTGTLAPRAGWPAQPGEAVPVEAA